VIFSANSALSHPDYPAHFDWFASYPEHIGLASDPDWGPVRLSKWLPAHEMSELALSYFGNADRDQADLPPFHELEPFRRVSGWIAISPYNRLLSSRFSCHTLQGTGRISIEPRR
jgi:hypothetical protein